jgi:CheY-like chemotaxis protein/anti-sigma regulatory factor (Ser/Thr protein kinase)
MSAAAQAQVKRVLVIDDDPAVLRLLSTALERKNFATAGCGNGASALSTLSAQPYDVIVLDLSLPDVHGLELIRQLRDVSPGARVVIITADTTSEMLLRAIREQAFYYIRKPFEINEVVGIVENAALASPEPAIEVHSAKPDWIELSLPCTHTAVDRVEHFIRQLTPSMPDEVAAEVTQAFRELLLNAVEWGGGLDPQHRVRICCVRTERTLLYRIADPGPGFRFDHLDHSAASNEEGAFAVADVRAEKGLRPGGFGIRMAKAIADELIYNELQNEVILIKYLDPQPPKPDMSPL